MSPTGASPVDQPAGRATGDGALGVRRRRCRWAALGCAVLGLLLLLPLFTLDGPGSWRTAWRFGLPALVGVAGMALGVAGRRVRLVVANLVCGLLSVPLLLVVATLVLGP